MNKKTNCKPDCPCGQHDTKTKGSFWPFVFIILIMVAMIVLLNFVIPVK